MSADLVILGGKVWTADATRPSADAVAVRADRIVAVGADRDVRPMIGPATQVIDAAGRRILPGFNDAHVHLLQGGFHLLGLDLRAARDESEFAALVARHVADLPDGRWISGGNWDHEAWPGGRLPARQLLDTVTPRNPALLRRLDGHIALANSIALRAAGIGDDSPDPPGGRILRDDRGRPTGILIDTAMDLVHRCIPAPTEDDALAAARAALRHAARLGVTSLQTIADAQELTVLRRLRRSGELTVRVYAMAYDDLFAEIGLDELLAGRDDLLLHTGAVKLFADGSLGASSALFFEPYADAPHSCGLAIHDEPELRRRIAAVDAAGLQVAVHAIGDKAVAWTLDALDCAARSGGRRDARHRVEHAQMVRPQDRPRFARLGAVASIQPSHCTDDMRWVAKRMGSRTATAYPFQSLLQAGARVALGTDWYVEPLDPMLTLHAAVTREFPDGGPTGGWHPEERVTIGEAVDAYTRGSAWAEFRETHKGSIAVGKLADLLILSDDIMTIAPPRILETKVDLTVVAGRVVHERSPSAPQ